MNWCTSVLSMSKKSKKKSFNDPHSLSHTLTRSVCPDPVSPPPSAPPGVRQQRVGDQYRGGGQLRGVGPDLRDPPRRHGGGPLRRQAVGHRPRQLQENTHGGSPVISVIRTVLPTCLPFTPLPPALSFFERGEMFSC